MTLLMGRRWCLQFPVQPLHACQKRRLLGASHRPPVTLVAPLTSICERVNWMCHGREKVQGPIQRGFGVWRIKIKTPCIKLDAGEGVQRSKNWSFRRVFVGLSESFYCVPLKVPYQGPGARKYCQVFARIRKRAGNRGPALTHPARDRHWITFRSHDAYRVLWLSVFNGRTGAARVTIARLVPGHSERQRRRPWPHHPIDILF